MSNIAQDLFYMRTSWNDWKYRYKSKSSNQTRIKSTGEQGKCWKIPMVIWALYLVYLIQGILASATSPQMRKFIKKQKGQFQAKLFVQERVFRVAKRSLWWGKKHPQLSWRAEGFITEQEKTTKGKEYLLPPSQKFKTPLSATYSPQIKLITDSSQSLLSSTCTADNDLSCELSRREASRVKEQVSLKFYSDSQGKKWKSSKVENIKIGSFSEKPKDQNQREKIINSWMQFFG